MYLYRYLAWPFKIVRQYYFFTAEELYRYFHNESFVIRPDVLLLQFTARNFDVLAPCMASWTTSVSAVSAVEVWSRCGQPLLGPRDHNQSLHTDRPPSSLFHVSVFTVYIQFYFSVNKKNDIWHFILLSILRLNPWKIWMLNPVFPFTL